MKAFIVGGGHWHAPWHIAALRAHGIEVVGLWDHNPEAAARKSGEWSVPVATIAEILAAQPDLVLLSPRAVDAPDLLAQFISARIPVIAEKPLGLRGSDVQALAALRARAESFVAVTLVNRLSPIWPVIDGMKGSDLIASSFRIVNGTPQRYLDDDVGWVLDPELGGGGALRNLGIHAADAICSLPGANDLTVTAATLTRSPDWKVEIHAAATIQSSAGWSATLEAGYTLPDREGNDFEWRVATTEAYLVDHDHDLLISDMSGTRTVRTLTSAARYNSFIGRTLEDLSSGSSPIASIDDLARAATLVDRIYDTASATAEALLEGER